MRRDYLKHLGFATAQAMAATPTPMTLPQDTKSKIIAEARKYACDKEPNDDYVDNALCSYAAGATEWAGKAQKQIDDLVSALKKVESIASWINEPEECKAQIMNVTAPVLAKYKEVGNEKK